MCIRDRYPPLSLRWRPNPPTSHAGRLLGRGPGAARHTRRCGRCPRYHREVQGDTNTRAPAPPSREEDAHAKPRTESSFVGIQLVAAASRFRRFHSFAFSAFHSFRSRKGEKSVRVIRNQVWAKPCRPLCYNCLLYTSPSPRDLSTSRMPSSA